MMNPGATEEGVKGFMEAMRSQPLSLALVVCNLALLGVLYYTAVTAANERHQEMQLLYENRTTVGKLLQECIPASVLPQLVPGR